MALLKAIGQGLNGRYGWDKVKAEGLRIMWKGIGQVQKEIKKLTHFACGRRQSGPAPTSQRNRQYTAPGAVSGGSSATAAGAIAISSHRTAGSSALLLPESPVSVLWQGGETAGSSSEAIVVSMNMPPIPTKLAGKIWWKEFIELDALRLGAPEPTLQDLVCGEKRKGKKGIVTIQEWVGCFNTYIAVAIMKDPARAKDLLAYSSLIVKASSDYEKLGYDRLFRWQAAADKSIHLDSALQPSNSPTIL